MKDKKPNFLFIMTDQQRRDSLGCYGNKVIKTPNLDKLARDGTVFDNMFTTNVVCMPSRASYLTGRYPSSHGLKSNGIKLPESEITLPQVLSDDGYKTCSIGKIHLSAVLGDEEHPESRSRWETGKRLPIPYYGFQEILLENVHGSGQYGDYYYHLKSIDKDLPKSLDIENALEKPSGAPYSWKSSIPEEHHSTTWIADNVVEKIKLYSYEDQPFFMMASFPDPHFPFCPPEPYCDLYDLDSVIMPSRSKKELETASDRLKHRWGQLEENFGYHPLNIPDKHIREIISHTYGMVTLIDKSVGRILSALEENGLDDNTIVVFTTDHGEHLGDHWLLTKMIAYDELTRIPSIWKVPGQLNSNKRISEFARNIDVMPTILDFAGVDIPYGVQGKSFMDGLLGKPWEGPRQVLIEGDDPREICNYHYEKTLRTDRYLLNYYNIFNDGELFDMHNDPNQYINLWNDSGYKNIKNELIMLLMEEMMGAIDPLPTSKFFY